jgi:hypothetical protein
MVEISKSVGWPFANFCTIRQGASQASLIEEASSMLEHFSLCSVMTVPGHKELEMDGVCSTGQNG